MVVGTQAWELAVADIDRTHPVVLVVDEKFAALNEKLVQNAHHALGSASCDLIPLASHSDFEAAELLSERLARQPDGTIVAVGGGAVLVLVKLACHQQSTPSTAAVLKVRGAQAGAVHLPAATRAVRRRVFVPTTIGTGVEVSAVGCALLHGHKRLFMAQALRPDVAVLDPRFTETLPGELLAEGVLEALLRVIGPWVGGASTNPMADISAAVLVELLVAVGDRIAGNDTGARLRVLAAQLSAMTHTSWALVGRNPFGAKHWYLANELSVVAGVRKMTATACLLPSVWTRIVAGDRRYGDPARLAMVWRIVRTASGVDLDPDPASGVAELLDHWRIGRRITVDADTTELIARRTVRSWAGHLPMLAGLTATDITELILESAC